MYVLAKIKKQIAKEINKILGKKKVEAGNLVYPPKPELGDLSLPLFNEAEVGITAEELFRRLGGLAKKAGWELNLAGKFLNFKLNKQKLAQATIEEIFKLKERYGRYQNSQKQRIVIEYSNANTHKEYHIGHLRNICLGDAVNRILEANGWTSIPVSYINDFGIHVAKTLWAYNEFYKGQDFKDKKPFGDKPENKGEFLGQVYARAVKELENNESTKRLVELIMKKIESKQGKEYALWQKTRQWSIKQFAKIYKELGVEFEKIFYESELIEKGRQEVDKLVKKGVLRKSEGAVIADLRKYDLGVLVVIRSDNTAAYPVADIALAREKIKKFQPDESVYVVDKRQSLYFKQLFKILELSGYSLPRRHMAYEFVKLPSGMISSREGNIISYENLRQEVFSRASQETKKRHPEWSQKKIEKTAFILTNGALKFEMIKVGAGQVIIFDIQKALSFSGFTAAYLQYTYARISSILRKYSSGVVRRQPDFSKNDLPKIDINYRNLKEEKEHKLILQAAKYPEAVARAGQKREPAEIAKYLFELAQTFNDYYHSTSVLRAKEEVKLARLALIKSISQTIKNGLNLLGIGVIEEM